MKIFLDTTRLLAEKTDNLIDELWNYIKDRKLVQTSVLLLAAQKQIRKHDWFNIIMYRIFKEAVSLKFKSGSNGVAQKQLEVTFQLVSVIFHAGEALDKYIQTHSEFFRRRFSNGPIPKDFSRLGPSDTNVLLQDLKNAIDKLNIELDVLSLKAEFEKDVRPLLISRCLMLSHSVDHVTDVMIRMKGMVKEKRKHFVDHIIARRVLVADDWINTYGNIEILAYDLTVRDKFCER